MKTGCRLAGLLLFFMLTLAPAAGWSVVVSSVGALQSAVDNANAAVTRPSSLPMAFMI